METELAISNGIDCYANFWDESEMEVLNFYSAVANKILKERTGVLLPEPLLDRGQSASNIRPALPSSPAPLSWKSPKQFKRGDDGQSGDGRTRKIRSSKLRKYPEISRVILAEDDADDAEFFGRSLSKLSADINLSIVSDGHELIRELKRSQSLPDLVFVDINMPRKNGYECTAEIRNDSRLHNLPVIIVSTSGDPETVDALYHLGATAFITKPKDFSSWGVLIDKVLSRRWSAPRVRRDDFLIEV